MTQDINWLESNRSKRANKSISPRCWTSVCPHHSISASWMTHPQAPWQFHGQPFRSKVGSGPILGNPHSFPQISGTLLPLISLWNYSFLLKLTTSYSGAFLAFCDGPHTWDYLNKSLLLIYNICLSLNPLCNEPSITWTSLSPEISMWYLSLSLLVTTSPEPWQAQRGALGQK